MEGLTLNLKPENLVHAPVCHLSALCLWRSHLTSLNLIFLSHEMEKIIATRWVYFSTKWHNIC